MRTGNSEPMFYGQYTIPFSSKKILTLPEAFASSLSGDVFVTQGIDRNLLIMPESTFTELYRRVIAMNIADPLARLLQRLFLGNATLANLSQSRQMELSERLCEYAELSDENVILVGQGDYFEVWSRSHWEKQNADLQDAKTNADRFAYLDLSF